MKEKHKPKKDLLEHRPEQGIEQQKTKGQRRQRAKKTRQRRIRPYTISKSVWNGLPLALRLLPRVHSDAFYSSLKTALFSRARVRSASE